VNAATPDAAAALTADEAAKAAREKTYRTLQAWLAMKGHELNRLDDGRYLVSRWGLTKVLPNLQAVSEFARQVGVAV